MPIARRRIGPRAVTTRFVTAGLVSNQFICPDLITVTDLPHSLPILNVMIPPSQLGDSRRARAAPRAPTKPGYCSYTALMNSGFLNNNKYWSTHYDGLNGYSVHDQVTGFTLDGDYEASLGFFDKLLFGAGYSHREKNARRQQQRLDQRLRPVRHAVPDRGLPGQCNPYSFGSQGFNVISFTSPPNFMQGAGGSYPSVLPRLNTAQLLAFLESLNGKANPFFCTTLPCATPFNFAIRCRSRIRSTLTM